METYNYDDPSAAPGFGSEGSVMPSVPDNGTGNDVPPAPDPGQEPEGTVTPSVPDNTDSDHVPATPGFGTLGSVTPSLPAGSSLGMGCVNCSGSAVWPNSSSGILWTWGTLSPFFSTNPDIAHVRFYNAAAIREPLDIYLNGRLLVSNLDYMNYTRYLHIIPGIYRLTVFRRTNPGSPIIDTGVQFRGGGSYTLTILGTDDSYFVQVMTS